MPAPNEIMQLRLLVGDVAQDFPFLSDDTYQWILDGKAGDMAQLRAAVDALEMIINQIALSPQSVKTEEITEIGPLVSALENRLNSLKAKVQAGNGAVTGFPMIIKSDRKNWDDLNNLFGKC